MHTRLRVAVVAALTVLGLLVPTLAYASHDPDPPYVSSSQPGGYELFGFHHEQISVTVNCWSGQQRRGSDGWYRAWWKCQGDGRNMAVDFADLYFYDYGYATYHACSTACTKGPSTGPIYYTGTFHPVAESVSVKATSVKARYIGGAGTNWASLCSWRTPVGQRSPIGGAPC